ATAPGPTKPRAPALPRRRHPAPRHRRGPRGPRRGRSALGTPASAPARATRTRTAPATTGFRLLPCVVHLALGAFPRLLDRIGTFIEPLELPLERNVARRGWMDSDTVGRGRHGLLELDCDRAAWFRSGRLGGRGAR